MFSFRGFHLFSARTKPQSTRHAFSLIEAAIVLGVVGLVIGGIWVAMASFRYKFAEHEFINGWGEMTVVVQSTLTQQIPCNTHIANMPGGCCSHPAIEDIMWPKRITPEIMRTLSYRNDIDSDMNVRCENSGLRFVDFNWAYLKYDKCLYLSRVLGTVNRTSMHNGLVVGCDNSGQNQHLSIEIPRRD